MNTLEQVQAFLCSNGITAEVTENELTTFIQCGAVGCRLKVIEKNGLLKIFILWPLFAPIYRRAALIEGLTLANFNLNSGAFEIDKDGEVRFRNSVPHSDGEIPQETLRHLLFGSWSVCATYASAISEIILTDADPELAIERCEASSKEESRNTEKQPT